MRERGLKKTYLLANSLVTVKDLDKPKLIQASVIGDEVLAFDE